MKRIITHPEETIYELVANSDCLEFWKSITIGQETGMMNII